MWDMIRIQERVCFYGLGVYFGVGSVHNLVCVADLARLSHENTGKLLGYCIDTSQFQRMLVFEYASNGTLYEHLHCKSIFILFMSKYMLFSFCLCQNTCLLTLFENRPGGWVGPKCVLFVFLMKRSAFIFMADEEGCHLSWSRRMNIMIGVAKGLRYLHMEIEPPFTISKLNSSAVVSYRRFFTKGILQ
ncbi:putative protein kinase RLK-Pelle-LRR-VI-2 family [Helianthus annuus]|nr:putative protein kinase RLK-Pelle-LRR-VI-2 family [Helianthus annuus]KAJ0867139.1 putative protein kinase RLK-Pelle-LRR-VI-2 family [Helianthus annuus]